jgi:hypothetical protein
VFAAARSRLLFQRSQTAWNFNGPRWRGRPEVKEIREQDTDWKKWLLTKPDRPFDPRLYFEFRLYHEFSSGIPDQWVSHGISRAFLHQRTAAALGRFARRRVCLHDVKTPTPSRRSSNTRLCW